MNSPETQQAMLVEMLRQASSQNTSALKLAETSLLEWETHRGYYTALFDIFTNYNIDMNVRWMAAVCTKNGIDKYWRKNAPNAIDEGEKQLLRVGLLVDFKEPVSQIATQKAVLISKIARMDTKDWPELFPTLLNSVISQDSLVQHRALLTLYHVIKAISSKRLGGDRKQFQDLTQNIYSYILDIWNSFTNIFHLQISQNGDVEEIMTNLEKALLSLRILRKLSTFGFYKPHFNNQCMTFLKSIFDRIKTSLECRKQLQDRHIIPYVLELCEKYITHLTKILQSILDVHPLSFIDCIKSTLEISVYYLFTAEGQVLLFERFTIQCLNLIKAILLCQEFKPPKLMVTLKTPETLTAHKYKQEVFQAPVLTEICRKLVTQYFILRQNEIDAWIADPETYVNDEGGESWKYSLRPSIETAFATIFHEYSDILAVVLMEMLVETNHIVSPDDMDGILKKDAVYNAVGIAAYDMYDEVDFDQWFSTTLLQELTVKHNNYRVIRRRVCSLIGNWTGIKLSPSLRPALYDCVVDLLSPEEDIVVRLTASTALRHAIDDFEFNGSQFEPWVDRLFNLLFQLLKSANECETKMYVLNVMSLMIERIGQTISPYSEALLNFIPYLWVEADNHNMLRCAIVSTMVQLVAALGHVTSEMNQFLLPIIRLGTNMQESASVYLLEDTLHLWQTILENTAEINPELLQLCQNIPILLETSTEYLRECLFLVLRYILLAPVLFMNNYGGAIIHCCDCLMADMRSEGVAMLLRVVDKFIRADPVLGCETVKPILPRIFETIYKGDELPMILSQHLCIVSRVLLSSHEVFIQTLNVIAQKSNDTPHNILILILTVWTNKMPNVTQIEHRKLLSKYEFEYELVFTDDFVGIALLNITTMQIKPILDKFPSIIVNILETLNDVIKTDENGIMTDSLLLTDEKSPSHFHDDDNKYCDTSHDLRKKQLILSDPVYTTVLRDYLQSQLFVLKSQMDSQHYEQLLSLVDGDTISQFKEYGITL